MIEINELRKTFGATQAVDGVSFTAPEGSITAFLGPNGAGKTSTLRMLLGLARPDAGTATINGSRYVDLVAPRRTVGAVLDSIGFHPARTGRNHLRVLGRASAIGGGRVDDVLELVGLTDAADRRVGGYSLGMKQRLALGAALLGDPPVLVLDEPGTGLDPAGTAWLRQLLRDWAGQGRTVLYSSHVLAEVETVADRVVIIDHGQVLRDATTAELAGGDPGVAVRTPDNARLRQLADLLGWQTRGNGDGRLVIHGASATAIGAIAAREGIVLAELATEPAAQRLEELFLELTGKEERP